MIFRIQRRFGNRKVATALAGGGDGPISGRSKKRTLTTGGRVLLGLFFSVFLAVGIAATYALALRPWLGVWAAREWQAVPCVILSSEVRSHSGDSTTYSVAISYVYQMNGRDYTGERYDFTTGSSSGRKAKAQIVAQFREGMHAICYVNPADPTQVVLERSKVRDWGYGLIPLVFVLVGGGGVWFAIFGQRKAKESSERLTASPATFTRASASAPDYSDAAGDVGSGELKPVQSRKVKVIGAIIIALFWNGIVSVFVVNIVRDALHGSGFMWFFALFLLPFVAIGLFLLGVMVRQILALANPVPRVTVARRAIAPGETLTVDWQFDGKTTRLQSTHILLEGVEEATYRRGTDTKTDREVFATFTLAENAGLTAGQPGRAELRLPERLMHTFSSGNNRIRWALRLKSEISGWPDVDESFEIVVRPIPPASTS